MDSPVYRTLDSSSQRNMDSPVYLILKEVVNVTWTHQCIAL